MFLYTREGCPDSLASCFAHGNFVLVFCGKPAAGGEKELAEEAKALSASLGPEASGALAFAREDASFRRSWIAAELCGSGKGECFLSRGCRFSLQGYRFFLPAGTLVRVEQEQRAAGEVISLHGGRRGYAAEFAVEGGWSARIAALSLLMEGEKAGCFCFDLELLEGIQQLRMSIRFSMERENPEHGRYVDTLSLMPFFALFAPIPVHALLDVEALDDKERSRFLLPAGRYGSFFPVYCGENLCMKAEKGDISLVFQKERLYRSSLGYCRYLSPEGSMEIESPGGSLLTGLSGLEYVTFEKGARLYFHSGGKAYFPRDEQEGGDVGTTSYLSLSAGMYYSQGETASFFGGIGKGSPVLPYLEVPFCEVGREDVFPMLPVGIRSIPEKEMRRVGLLPGARLKECMEREESPEFSKKLAAMDTRRLAQQRNRRLGRQAKDAKALGEAVLAITQKGLLASFQPGAATFLTVEIADKVRLSNVSGELRQALLSSRAFLMISDKEDFLKYASLVRERDPLAADGWAFDLSPELWEENGTFLLMKYTRHKSIRELAAAAPEWSYPAGEGLARKNARLLQDFLDDIDNKEGMEGFDGIRRIAGEKDWCGAIVVSVQVDGQALPDDIRFLVKTGSVPLLAHHLVFENRTVGKDGNVLPAGMSGVIYYNDPFHPAMDGPGEFYYKLDLLLVVIEESRVVNFQCDLSLSFQYFLKSPLYALDSDKGNYMLVRGRMTKKADDSALAEYFFALAEPREYQADGSAIDTLKVEAVSLLASAREDRARFFLSGQFHFVQYEGDIFSYGGGDSCLYFQDLCLVCQDGRFSGDISAMRFLMDAGKVRKGSLGEQFPLSWKRFFVMDGKDGAQKLGYTAIHCDGIRQQELGDSFACIEMEINLGGLGALAAAGDLKLSLLAAWTPYAPQDKYDGSVEVEPPGLYVGARLGAFSGVSSPIPLQGVMSLEFGSVELKKSAGSGEFYLYFRDFSVKLLKYQFPDGNNDIYVFGNAKNPKELGWYGAYEAKGKKEGN